MKELMALGTAALVVVIASLAFAGISGAPLETYQHGPAPAWVPDAIAPPARAGGMEIGGEIMLPLFVLFGILLLVGLGAAGEGKLMALLVVLVFVGLLIFGAGQTLP